MRRWLAIAVLLAGCDRLLGLGGITPHPVDAMPDALAPGHWDAVAAGSQHTCAIRDDHTLWCWGRNLEGQLGLGSQILEVDTPTRVGSALWTAIASSELTTCGIQTDQSLWCWGVDTFHQVGPNGTGTVELAPVVVDASRWTSVSTSMHTCAIRDDQSLWCWGFDLYGELGDDQKVVSAPPARVLGPEQAWLAVSVGHQSTCAIAADQTLWCWGDNMVGQLGDGTFNSRAEPVQVGSDHWLAVAVGQASTCALRSDHHLRCWGANQTGELGDSTTSAHPIPTIVGTDSDDWTGVVVASGVSFQTGHACGVHSDGTMGCWGDNTHGQLGTDRAIGLTSSPLPVAIPGVRFVAGAGAMNHTCMLSDDHNLWCSGGNAFGELAMPSQHRAPVQVAGTWAAFGAGYTDTCAQSSAGISCWGGNEYGQLGEGTTDPRQAPVAIATGADHSAIAIGLGHACELRGGVEWCWGLNGDGDFGDGTTSSSVLPEQIPSTSTWKTLVAGNSHTCAIDNTSKLSCWGWNGDDELSNVCPTIECAAPVGLAMGTTAVGTGATHTCAIIANAVQCWGENFYQQCGSVSTGNLATATVAAMPSNFTAVKLALGYEFSCALDATGRAACWGHNGAGQLGLGTAAVVVSPAMLQPGGHVWRELAGGKDHACAVDLGGELWCWGDNEYGQLGDGNVMNPLATSPQRVGSDTDWMHVVAGWEHSCAEKQDGTLWCWGDNTDGELGANTAWRTGFSLLPAP